MNFRKLELASCARVPLQQLICKNKMKPWSTEGLELRGWVNGPKWWSCRMAFTHFADPWNVPQLTTKIDIWQLNKMVNSPKICRWCFLYFLLLAWWAGQLQRLIIHFFILSRNDSKFDMREAYCWRSNDAYVYSRSSRIEKECNKGNKT